MNVRAGALGLALAFYAVIGCSSPTAATTGPSPTSAAALPTAATAASAVPTTTPAGTPSPSTTPLLDASPSVPVPAQPAVSAATRDLAGRLGTSPDAISVVSVTRATWPNGALGCPKPGVMYSQIVTPGYRIVLAANGQNFEYHSGRGSTTVSCTLP